MNVNHAIGDERGIVTGRPAIDTESTEPMGTTDDAVARLRSGIERTRADMGETIGELRHRLDPAHLKDQLKEQVRDQVKEQVTEHYNQVKDSIRQATLGKVEVMVERMGETVSQTRRSIVETVTANPIPSALVGIGLAWLLMNRGDGQANRPGSSNGRRSGNPSGERSDDSDQSWGDRASAMAGEIQGTATELAGKIRESAAGAIDQAQGAASRIADQAQTQGRRAQQHFDTAMRDGPLAVGAIALAMGTAVGLALPRTRKENEWMGEARDTFVDNAQAAAGSAIEHVAQTVTDELPSMRT
jgi:ElaB/YqjD/DUF883 family membrane-anchored ribosome-binding protein